MPLNEKGKEALKEFKKEYGQRGKFIFYSYMKRHPLKTKEWHINKRK
jgi:hypothetical protein